MSFLTISYRASFFNSLNPVLASGEFGIENDTGKIKVGDGATLWQALPYGIPANSEVQGATGIVDFGTFTPEETTARSTVAASWVTLESKLQCTVLEGENYTADEIAAEQVTATIGTVVAGVGFEVVLSSMQGSTGKFVVNILGY